MPHGIPFWTYVEEVPAPALRPEDLIIVDSLGSYKRPGVRRAIRDAGGRPFLLPKYSPDMNLIEQVFARFKHLFRKASSRTREAVCSAISQRLDAFTPEECANHVRNSAYKRTHSRPRAGAPPRSDTLARSDGSVRHTVQLLYSAERGRPGLDGMGRLV